MSMISSFSDDYSALQITNPPAFNTNIPAPVSGVSPNTWGRALQTQAGSPSDTNTIGSNLWTINTSSPDNSISTEFTCVYGNPTPPLDLSSASSINFNVPSITVTNATVLIRLLMSDGINPIQSDIPISGVSPYSISLAPFTSILSNINLISLQIVCESQDKINGFSAQISINNMTSVNPQPPFVCPFNDSFEFIQSQSTTVVPSSGVNPLACTRSLSTSMSVDGTYLNVNINSSTSTSSIYNLVYVFDSPMNISCVTNFILPLSFTNKNNVLVNIQMDMTDSQNNVYTFTTPNIASNAIVNIPLNPQLINQYMIKSIQFKITGLSADLINGYSCILSIDSITSISGAAPILSYSIIPPYKCNNGIIKVTTRTSQPPYRLIGPGQQTVVNNTGVFYIVEGGVYLLSSHNIFNTCCPVMAPQIIVVPNNKLWCN